MFQYLVIGNTKIPMFSVCVAVGICVFVFAAMLRVRRTAHPNRETYFIVPKLFMAVGFGYLGAGFFDALFMMQENGGLKLSGIMFYGGALTGMLALVVIIKIRAKKTDISIGEWLNILTVPFIMFHCIGRIGCFLGGCCYGMVTDGPFGVLFPDVPSAGIFHNGQKVLPTQLFEAAGLAVMAVALLFVKRDRFAVYTVAYAALRFSLEFLRGDNRGIMIAGLSPSQFIAVLAVYVTVAIFLVRHVSKHGRRLLAPI